MIALNDEVARVSDVRGVYDDGWCGPLVTFRLEPSIPVGSVELEIWIKPEEARDECRFEVRAGHQGPFGFAAVHDRRFKVEAACRCGPGEEVDVRISCDNRATKLPEDSRRLSFHLLSVRPVALAAD